MTHKRCIMFPLLLSGINHSLTMSLIPEVFFLTWSASLTMLLLGFPLDLLIHFKDFQLFYLLEPLFPECLFYIIKVLSQVLIDVFISLTCLLESSIRSFIVRTELLDFTGNFKYFNIFKILYWILMNSWMSHFCYLSHYCILCCKHFLGFNSFSSFVQ